MAVTPNLGLTLLAESQANKVAVINANSVLLDDAAGSVLHPYDIAITSLAAPAANKYLFRIQMGRAVSLPANLIGSKGVAFTGPAAAVSYELQKNGAAVGSIDFALGATVATFTAVSQIDLAVDDIFAVFVPVAADQTIAVVGITLKSLGV